MRNRLHWLSAISLVSAIVVTPFAALAETQPTSSKKPATPTSEAAPRSNKKAGTKTIAEIAATNNSFKTLTAAVKAAGLTEVLAGKTPLTVFAPTDAAFAKLPPGVVDAFLKPENKAQLVKLLTYHVVPGSVPSTALKNGEVKTVEGRPVTIKVGTAGVEVNNAKVIKPDVTASNGVIHVIDTVIVPSDLTASPRKPNRTTTAPIAPKTQPTTPTPR
ncbi:MAG: fasciclin [Leptolyngbya sp. ERB_1_1]